MLNLAPRIAIGLTLPWSKRAPPLYLLLRSLCSCTSSLLLETLSAIPLFTFFHVFTSLLLRFLFLFLFLFFLFSFITLFYFHDGGISLFFAFNIRHGGTHDSTDLSRTRWVFHRFRINLLYPSAWRYAIGSEPLLPCEERLKIPNKLLVLVLVLV